MTRAHPGAGAAWLSTTARSLRCTTSDYLPHLARAPGAHSVVRHPTGPRILRTRACNVVRWKCPPTFQLCACGHHARCAASSAAAIGLAVPAAAITRKQMRQLVPLGLGLFMLQARVLCRLCLPCDQPGGMLGVVRWPLRRPEVCDMQSVQRTQGVRSHRPPRCGNRGLCVVVLHVLFV